MEESAQLKALQSLVEATASPASVRQVICQGLDTASRVLGVEAILVLARPDGADLYLRSGKGGADGLGVVPVSLEGQAAGRAMTAREPVVVADTGDDGRPGLELERRAGLKPAWVLALPMRVGDRTLGALELVGTASEGEPDGAHPLLEAFAAVLAGALARAQAGEEAIRQARAEGAEQAVALLAARLRTIGSGIQAGAILIDKSLPEDDLAKAKKGWGVVSRHIGQLQCLIANMLCFAADTAGQKEPTDLKKLLQSVGESVRARAAAKGVKLVLPNGNTGPVTASVDPAGMRHAVRSLIEWAVERKEKPGGAQIEIRIEPAGAQEPVTLTIREDCTGAPADELLALFSGADCEKSPGVLTLCLASARKVVELQGGSLTVAREEPDANLFTIRLPR